MRSPSMLDWALPVPATLQLDTAERERLSLPPGPLELRRARPQRGGDLTLEYATTDGRLIVGQWFAVQERLDRVARKTAQASQAPSAIVPGTGIFLQTRGADRRLPVLAPLAARDGATLVRHRPERCAVVSLQAAEGTRYLKVVRPECVEAVTATGRAAQRLAGTAFTTPRLLEVDVASGVIAWSGLDGVLLHDLFGTDRLTPAMRAVGEALRALHGATPTDGLGLHSAVKEIRVLEGWLEWLEVFVPDLHRSLRPAAPAVFAALAAASSPPVLLHGDFSDMQVLIDDAGRVGIVDFDSLGTGEAGLDVANALVKIELRAMQGLCTASQAEEAIVAFLEGCQPPRELLLRINAYAAGKRLRQACSNAFCPAWAPRVPAMLLDRLSVGYPSVGRSISGQPRVPDLVASPISAGKIPSVPAGAS